ncbi:MAG TPA: hypothetical protein VFH51_13145 [Myxococcota bacterium]|nr:hypothetical protein [Myxococcota bacterium]
MDVQQKMVRTQPMVVLASDAGPRVSRGWLTALLLTAALGVVHLWLNGHMPHPSGVLGAGLAAIGLALWRVHASHSDWRSLSRGPGTIEGVALRNLLAAEARHHPRPVRATRPAVVHRGARTGAAPRA